MQKIILTLTLLISSFITLYAQNDSIPQSNEQQVKAKNIALKWFNLLAEAKNVDALMDISKVPFALDRTSILNTDVELKELYNKVIENKGKQVFYETTSVVHLSKYEILNDCIPINVLVIKISILEDGINGDEIFISVGISGNEFKVIGFSD